MPDVAPPPAAPVAPAPTTPAPQPDSGPTGIAKLMADMDSAVSPQKPAKPEAAPKPEAAKPEATKPEAAKPDATKPEAAKPDEVNWEKAPPKLYKAYKTLKETTDKTVNELKQEIATLKTKKDDTAPDTKLFEQYQTKIKELEKELAQAAYERSPQFKKDYVERLNGAYKSALEEITQLTVNEGDEENPKERPATKADFDRLMNLPPREQGIMARKLFGDAADIVLSHRNDLVRMSRDMQSAIAKAHETHEATAKEKELSEKTSREQYESFKTAARTELESKWPDFFGDKHDDENVTKAIQTGREFVAEFETNGHTLSPQQRAERGEIVKAWASAFPRMFTELKLVKAERDSLKEELSKFRKSDPGAAEGAGGGGENPDAQPQDGGIDAMASQFGKK